jgi:hypothetical protein
MNPLSRPFSEGASRNLVLGCWLLVLLLAFAISGIQESIPEMFLKASLKTFVNAFLKALE